MRTSGTYRCRTPADSHSHYNAPIRISSLQWLALIALIALAAFVYTTAGVPPPTPNPPNAFSFAVLGDAPYYKHEEWRQRLVWNDIEAHDLASVIHVGDIFWRPCSDAMYAKTRKRFDAVRHPLIYTPGDNEWVDCWEPRVGGYKPLDRLAQIRRTFFSDPSRSMGRRPIALTSQRGYPENARWRTNDVAFATVHLLGSRNGYITYPGRDPALDSEARSRTKAAEEWTRETFAQAAGARAIVIGFHASLEYEKAEYRAYFEPFFSTLEREAVRFGKPVLIVQGDNHDFIVDRPLPAAPNITRLQVPGSPLVGWVRVTVNSDGASPWSFENYIVPSWKYW